MTDTHYRKPSEVSRRLDVSASTLRRWSAQFAEFLSQKAGDTDRSVGSGYTHRRYADDDMSTLSVVKNLLDGGQTYDQIRQRLKLLSDQEAPLAVASLDALVPVAPPQAVSFLSNAMHSVADGQQLLLSSQQANRDLLQVSIQDNFNLKEENARLRERMMRLEQELSENRRREEAKREMLERRLERLEDVAYRLDGPETEPDQAPARKGWLARLFGR